MILIASELMKVAKSLVGSAGLNGMSNREARKFVNALLQKHTRGFFNDDYWRPITKTFKLLAQHEIEYVIKQTEYTKDAYGNPDSKRWAFEIEFENDKGRKTTIYGTIVASGAGTVKDPLSRYDVVAYAN
jgi:hypothetical protein